MTGQHERGRAIYLTWDGPGSEYLGALYFPIFARMERKVTVVQLTYGTEEQRERAGAAAELHGVDYRPIVVSKPRLRSPPSFLRALLTAPQLAQEVRRVSAAVVGTKSVIPATIALAARRLLGRPFGVLFDADGLMQDERAEFTGWSTSGLAYRAFRELEYQALLTADAVVTRTERSRAILGARAGPGRDEDILVVPNGKDEARFAPATVEERAEARRWLGLPEPATVCVYAGSLGPQYYPEAMLELHRRMREQDPQSVLLLLTPHVEEAHRQVSASPAPSPSVVVRSLPSGEVPRALKACDVAFALRRPSFSQAAVSPIKVGEYLLSGLPVVATRGVGDLDRAFEGATAVRLVDPLAPEQLRDAAQWALDVARESGSEVHLEARGIGERHFGLAQAVRGYELAFDRADPSLGFDPVSVQGPRLTGSDAALVRAPGRRRGYASK